MSRVIASFKHWCCTLLLFIANETCDCLVMHWSDGMIMSDILVLSDDDGDGLVDEDCADAYKGQTYGGNGGKEILRWIKNVWYAIMGKVTCIG